jgi:hydroxymethylglutaryl-CoA lyase
MSLLMSEVRLIECPRDAWQGLAQMIPAEEKVAYLRRLIGAGFRHIDAVSFVSPKHVKQMADSEAVMDALAATGDLEAHDVEIIGIVVNEKGLERALACAGVSTIGYPYSISAYFRRANANLSRGESRALVEKIQSACAGAGRDVVVYISMAFGNPYGEPWGPELVVDTLEWLRGIGVRTVSLADTVGTATPEAVNRLYRDVRDGAAGMELGVHLHSRPEAAAEKVLAAFEAGCRRFDSALTGLGGCPFAGDHLVGNVATEVVIPTLVKAGADAGIQPEALAEAIAASREIAVKYAGAAVVH